ncbi:MAG: hypothetical protein LCH99_29585 [Proteobacteria bacterium]|nr:hypothetical protein [Pseudomonadota bacterium]
MPNAPVQATAEGLPGESEVDGGGRGRRFNLRQIMQAAWAHYRRAQAYVASNSYLRGTIVRFGDCLKAEWKHAKADVAKAERDAVVVARIDALKAEILTLDCKPFGMRIGAERRALVAELSTLEDA